METVVYILVVCIALETAWKVKTYDDRERRSGMARTELVFNRPCDCSGPRLDAGQKASVGQTGQDRGTAKQDGQAHASSDDLAQ